MLKYFSLREFFYYGLSIIVIYTHHPSRIWVQKLRKFITLLQMFLTDRIYRPSVSELYFTNVCDACGRAICGSSLGGTFEFRRRHECLSLVSVARCSGTSLCVGLITRPGETYRLCMCPVSVIRCYINL
jgi:hypothetical protein